MGCCVVIKVDSKNIAQFCPLSSHMKSQLYIEDRATFLLHV